MDTPNPIKYSDLIKPDNSISDLIKQLETLQQTYADTAKKLREEALQVSASIKNVSGATEDGRKAINDAAAATERLTAEEKKVTAAEEKNAKELARLKLAQQEQNKIEKLSAKLANSTAGSYNALSAQYALNKIRINAMSQAERDAAEKSEQLISKTNALYEAMKKMQAETGMHQLNVGNYKSALDGLGKVMQGVSGSASQLAGNLGVGGLGGSLSGLAAGAGPMGLAVAAVAGFTTAMVSGIDTAREYNKAVSVLQSITGSTADGLKELTEQARSLGATTTYTATEVIQLQTELAKLGYTQGDIKNMTDSVLYFAQATGASLAEASSMTGAALRMFQRDTTDTQEFVDKLAASTTKSALSFSYLDTALSIVSPVANAFGFQIEDVLSLLGQLANAGFDASSAATATRNILLNLADANGDLAKSIGHPVKNLDDLVAGLQQLDAAGVDLATSLELSDKRSVAAFNTFLKGAGDVLTLRDALNETNGTAEEMSKIMGDNLEGDIASLGSAWDDFMLEINEGQGVLRDIVQWLTNVIREIASTYNELKEYFADLWEKSESFRAVVVTLFTVIETNIDVLFTTIKNLSKAVWGLGEIIVGAFTLDWELIKDGWNTASNAIIDQVKEVATTVVDNVQEAADKINNTAATLTIKTAIVEPVGGQPTATQTKDGGTGQGEGGKKGMNIKRLNGKEYDLDVEEEAEEYEKAIKKYQEAQKKLADEREKAQRKAEQDAEKAYRAELSARRTAEDAQLALIEDSWQQKQIKINLQYSRQIEDLRHTLETQKDLTETARESINDTIVALEEQQTRELIKIEEERYAKELEMQKAAIEMKLKTVAAGSDEEKQLLMQQLDVSREIALLKAKTDEEKSDINKAFDIQKGGIADKFLQQQLTIFDQQQDLAQSEFDLLRNSEQKKTLFKLQAEKERWQKVLELNEQANTKMSDAEVSTIQNTIKRIEQEMESEKRGGDIYDLVGLNLDDDQKGAIQSSMDFATEQLNAYMESYVAAADAKVNAASKEVDSAQKALDKEIELRDKGYANDVATAQKELDMAKANQEKAQREQEKAQKRQAAIQTLQQIGDLVTGTAKIWGQLGFPWAIPAIAIMWGSFAAAKIKAKQATKTETYGKGTVEMLHGGSHQSGNDIDLGTKADGTKRRAEGGEYLAVINKQSSRKYSDIIPTLINSINNGTLETRLTKDSANIGAIINEGADISDLAADVHAIKMQGEKKTYTDNGAIVEVYKNCTRRIVKR